MADSLIPLNEVITALRAEIVESVKRSEDHELLFQLGDIELELCVVAKRESAADGKLKFSVLGIGAEAGLNGKISQELTQKVRLKLTPVMREPTLGGEILISSRRPYSDDERAEDLGSGTRLGDHA